MSSCFLTIRRSNQCILVVAVVFLFFFLIMHLSVNIAIPHIFV